MNIVCISLLGVSNSGKTTILKRFANELKLNKYNEEYIYYGIYSGKNIAVFTTGDNAKVIEWCFEQSKDLKIDLIVCCSHKGKTLTQLYNEILKKFNLKTINESRSRTLILYKEEIIENFIDEIYISQLKEIIDKVVD